MKKQETEGEGEGEGPPRGGDKRTTSMGHPIPAPEAPIPLVWTSSERCLSSPPTRPSQVWTSFSINSLCCLSPERLPGKAALQAECRQMAVERDVFLYLLGSDFRHVDGSRLRADVQEVR